MVNNQKIIQQKMKTAVSEVWVDIVGVSISEKPHELLEMYRANHENSEFRLIQTWFEVIG